MRFFRARKRVDNGLLEGVSAEWAKEEVERERLAETFRACVEVFAFRCHPSFGYGTGISSEVLGRVKTHVRGGSYSSKTFLHSL